MQIFSLAARRRAAGETRQTLVATAAAFMVQLTGQRCQWFTAGARGR